MAVLAYTAAIQDRIYRILGLDLATADTHTKELIDGVWTTGALDGGCALDALTHIQQIGQHFSLTTPANVVSEWESWLVWRTVMLAGKQKQPARTAQYEDENDRAEMAALDAYDRITISTEVPAEAYTLTVQNIRYYVVTHCARMRRWETVEGKPRLKPRLWPGFTIIDANIERVLRNLWNRADWRFKKRKMRMVITLYTVSDGAWTESSKTLTKSGAFAPTPFVPAGARVNVTAGTGARTGEYAVASTATTNGSIILSASLGTNTTSADGQTDIDATVAVVSFPDLAGETYDATATRKFYYNDGGAELCWAEDDALQARRAGYGSVATGRPAYFQTEVNGSIVSWHMVPFPDADYTLYGSVYVQGPTLTTLIGTTTPLARFPAEFAHVIKDAVLSEVLRHYGEKSLHDQIEREIEDLLPIFADEGRADDDAGTRDYYRDIAALSCDNQVLGGGL